MAEDDGVDQVNDALDALIALQVKYHDQTRDTCQINWSKAFLEKPEPLTFREAQQHQYLGGTFSVQSDSD